MSGKVREYATSFVTGMDTVAEWVNEVPLKPKTGAKIGVVLGMNPVTGPILGGIAAGGFVAYGASRVVKKLLEVTE